MYISVFGPMLCTVIWHHIIAVPSVFKTDLANKQRGLDWRPNLY
jgi:hypothetical protein